jgi:catalase
MMNFIKKIFFALLIIAVSLIALIAYQMQIHTNVTTDEIVPLNERDEINIAAKKAEKIVEDLQTTYAARGVHAKGHACVKAYVEVNKYLEPTLQHGVFETPGRQFKAWIRFSNSSSNMAQKDDNAKDARGMAIKLLHAGANLNGGRTQEFIAHNSPAFFVNSVKDYNEFVATKGDPLYFIQGYNPFKWRLRELWQLVTAYAPPPPSPLWTEYFSNTAYKLGPHNIKFKMKPCGVLINPDIVQSNDPDFLQHNLAKELANEEACMLLMVQKQNVNKKMPIEDPTVLWKEDESPFMPAAKITILRQSFDAPEQQQFCEDLSFSPWNALEAHRPIGALNRARKWVYDASSNYRHQANHTQVPDQLDW